MTKKSKKTQNIKSAEARVIQSLSDKLKKGQSSRPRRNKNRQAAQGMIPAADAIIMSSKINFSNPRRVKYPGSIRINGTELVSNLTAATGTVGEDLMNLPVSPSSLSNTRLAEFANLYEKYIFNRVRFVYVPNVGTNTAGSVILAYDRDIKDVLSSNAAARLRQASSMQGAKQCPVYKTTSMDCPVSYPEDGFFTGGEASDADARLSFQGRIHILNESGFTGASGTLWIDYDCEMFVPVFDREDLLIQSLNIDFVNTNSSDAITSNSAIYDTFRKESDVEIVSNGDTYSEINAPWDSSSKVIKIIGGGVKTAIDWFFHVYLENPSANVVPNETYSAVIPRLRKSDGTVVTNDLINAGKFILDHATPLWGGAKNFKTNIISASRWLLDNIDYDIFLDMIGLVPTYGSGIGYEYPQDNVDGINFGSVVLSVVQNLFSDNQTKMIHYGQTQLFWKKVLKEQEKSLQYFTRYTKVSGKEEDINPELPEVTTPSSPIVLNRPARNPSTETPAVFSPKNVKRF